MVEHIQGQGQAFGAVVKMPLGMPTSHIGVPRVRSQLNFRHQFLANVQPGRQHDIAQVVESLTPMWGIWIEFPAPQAFGK